MSPQHRFYVDRAETARAEADAATLDNVRDRCLRSEAAWNQLAERAARTEQRRSDSAAAAAGDAAAATGSTGDQPTS